MPWTSPAPGASIGRTDQGVDWSNVRSLVAVASGKIVQIFPNLQGFGQTIIEKIGNRYVYYAEESSGVSPTVRVGQTVRQGQEIAGGGGGGGIEVGFWNPAIGAAVASPGYKEGDVTASGQQFRSMLSGGSGGGQQTTLSQLWIQAGGSPQMANLMAAIAMAESSGNPSNVNSSSQATGLWQIEPATWAQYSGGLPFSDATNPLDNAKVAVAVLKGQGLGAWATYTSGAYKQFLNSASSTKVNYGGPNGGRVRPGGQSQDTGAGVDQYFQNYLALRDQPRTDTDTSNPTVSQSTSWFLGRLNSALGNLRGP